MTIAWRAPGRVNLIGEHTDYNDGWVLPCAIEQGCTATVATRLDTIVEVVSAQRPDAVRLDLADLRPGAGDSDWAGYALGSVWALRECGVGVPGLDVAVDSDVPVGSGLSSSAALVCAVASALDDLLGAELDSADLLAVTRSAENDYVGAPTGGMDQLASLRSVAGHALLCDMRTLTSEPVLFPDADASGIDLLVVDTRAPHRHADGEYRRRREGCEAAAAELGVPALRDVTDLDAALAGLDSEELVRYTRHVVTENGRVLQAAEALRRNDLAELGRLFTASHASMRDDFGITVAEVDLAAEALLAAGALGARMTGGGFGGCVIGLVARERVDVATGAVRAAFADRGFTEPTAFVAHPAGGAHRVPD